MMFLCFLDGRGNEYMEFSMRFFSSKKIKPCPLFLIMLIKKRRGIYE